MSLEKRTKNDIDTDKKPKIYFTCHPDDFDICFEKICADIFKTHDCAIFYKSDMSLSVPEKDRELDLKRNNLFVIPVTEKLLSTYNCTMSEEFPYALKENIPVLPILMEEVPDELYSASDNFGDLQYLNAVSKDDTAISYEEKLRKYLDSVLISEDLANRIRAAFDAYIFLSYRKKDRRHANELMRLIHSNPECRDIAIWFDEFLTPGESFNENIEKILDDCELFTLLVTPQLLEKITDENGEERDNYVISTELPLARKMKAEKGTDILAVEMEETDKESLISISIDDCVNARDEEGFRTRLLKSVSKIAHTENDNEPEHNFLIGLAYLEGIDVEVDRGRAAELITGAAEDGLPEAMIKLISMYTDGIGVERNQNEVIKWSEKLSDYYFNCIFTKIGNIKSKRELSELFSFYGEKNWEYVIRSFLLKTDSEIPFDTVKTLYEILMSYGICEYTLLFETGKELRMHKNETQCILVSDILVKSANGTYPPYGPLFWYVPEYGLYEELLIALDSMKENKDFTNALALTRDVCRIFGHYNEITEITQCIDGKTLLCNAALSGVRKGLCELFFSGYTDSTDGSDIYPRCFNIEEAKSWKETGCGTHGRMPVPFEDELGLYSHESLTELHGEYIGIVSLPFDTELIESKLNSKSCKKISTLILTPTENTAMTSLDIDISHIRAVFVPENIKAVECGNVQKLLASNKNKLLNKITVNITLIDDNLLYFNRRVFLAEGTTKIDDDAFIECETLEEIAIPNSVIKIGNSAFSSCYSLSIIDLPDSLQEIGSRAFESCRSIEFVKIPDGITIINNSTFILCVKLTTVSMPDGMLQIGISAFTGCFNLSEINLPDSIIHIDDGAFLNCSSLKSIKLPKHMTQICSSIFKDCISLKFIDIPQTVKEIGELAFYGCKSLREVKFYGAISQIGNMAFCRCEQLTNITFVQSVTYIGNEAFAGCTSLADISFPEGLIELGSGIFENCSSLRSVTFPSSLKTLGRRIFYCCEQLTDIVNCPYGYTLDDLGIQNKRLNEMDSAEWDDEKIVDSYNSKVIYNPISFDVVFCESDEQQVLSFQPDFFGVTIEFDEYDRIVGKDEKEILSDRNLDIFYQQMPLQIVDIPYGVQIIPDNEFCGNRALTEVNFSETVKIIGSGAFRGCKGLQLVNLPENLTHIGALAFADCSSLQQVIFADKVEEIGIGSFCDCALVSIRLPSSLKRICDKAFFCCHSLEKVAFVNGIQEIGTSAFERCVELQEIIIPDSVTEIGASAFCCCHAVTKIKLSENLLRINKSTFEWCNSLQKIRIPENVKSIGEKAFYYCEILSEINLPDSITHIGQYAFAKCSSLPSITLPEGITEIGGYAFRGCSSLTSITLPDRITKIGECAFSGCSSLPTIILPDRITKIGECAFGGCSSLTAITLPEGITEIGWYAFSSCSSLPSINLPDGITKIHKGTFSGCISLISIKIPDGVKEICASAFEDCVSLTAITIPVSVRILGDDAFKGCTGLREITISRRFEDELPKIFSDVDLSQVTINWI